MTLGVLFLGMFLSGKAYQVRFFQYIHPTIFPVGVLFLFKRESNGRVFVFFVPILVEY